MNCWLASFEEIHCHQIKLSSSTRRKILTFRHLFDDLIGITLGKREYLVENIHGGL